jgi:ABC-type uncharacterized transport system ATPase subunit
MRLMISQGKAIVFISHKLEEVMSIADSIAILRGARSSIGWRPRMSLPPRNWRSVW